MTYFLVRATNQGMDREGRRRLWLPPAVARRLIEDLACAGGGHGGSELRSTGIEGTASPILDQVRRLRALRRLRDPPRPPLRAGFSILGGLTVAHCSTARHAGFWL